MSALNSRSSALPTARAYLLLIGLLLILVYAFKPWLTTYFENKHQIERANVQLMQLKQTSQQLDDQQRQLQTQIKQRIGNGDIQVADSENDVHAVLQNIVKNASNAPSVTLRQMRPLKATPKAGIHTAQLEVSLDLAGNALATLLNHLQQQTTQPKIVSMIFRANNWSTANLQNAPDVSLTATLQQSWVNPDQLTEIGINPDELSLAMNSIATADNKNEVTQRNFGEIAGLFDPNARRRNRTDDLNFYSVSAISISESNRSVLILDTLNDQTIKLSVGDTLGDWSLKAIEQRQLTFVKGTEIATLNLATD